MKLDINEIYHNYIVRVVIFALFTYKRQLRQPNIYKMSVINFTSKRLPWKINLKIETENISKEEGREILLNQLFTGQQSKNLTTVKVIFTTPLKEVSMEVDLSDEDKFQKFLYL